MRATHMCDPEAPTNDPRTLPLLLTAQQAAKLLNVSDKHVRDLCARGDIKSVRIGKSLRIGRDALLEQYGILGTRRDAAKSEVSTSGTPSGDTAEIVIRIELPAELAERLADAKVVVSSSGI